MELLLPAKLSLWIAVMLDGDRLMGLNPNSFRKIVATLLEVNGRGY